MNIFLGLIGVHDSKFLVVIIFRFDIHLLFSLDVIVPRGSSYSSIELAKMACHHIALQ